MSYRKADLLLMDERRGRAVAADYGLPVTGLLGAWFQAPGFIHGDKRKFVPLMAQPQGTRRPHSRRSDLSMG